MQKIVLICVYAAIHKQNPLRDKKQRSNKLAEAEGGNDPPSVTVRQHVLNTRVSKNAFKQSYTVKCGNRLRAGARAQKASVLGFACRPF